MTDEAARADHADAAEQKLLVLDDVKVHFPIKRGLLFDRTVGHVYAVDGVSLHVNRGETYGLVGESGCGKTTLGRALLRLIEPTGGTITFDGIDLSSLRGEKLRTMRKRMQMVFQDPVEPRPTPVGGVVAGEDAGHGLATDPERTGQAQGTVVGGRAPRERAAKCRTSSPGASGSASASPGRWRCSGPDRGRRAGVGAGRVGAGTGDQPVGGPAERVRAHLRGDRHDLAVVRHLRPDRRDVPGDARGGIRCRTPSTTAAAPYTKALLSAIPVPIRSWRTGVSRSCSPAIYLSADPPRCRFHTRCPWRQETLCDTERPALRDVGNGHRWPALRRGHPRGARVAAVGVGGGAGVGLSVPSWSAGSDPNSTRRPRPPRPRLRASVARRAGRTPD